MREAWPCGIVSGVNGGKPCEFYWKTSAGMEVPYRCGNMVMGFGSCGAASGRCLVVSQVGRVCGGFAGMLQCKFGSASALKGRIEKASREDDQPWQDLISWPQGWAMRLGSDCVPRRGP